MKRQTSRLLLGTAIIAIAATLTTGCSKAPEAERVAQAPTSSVGHIVDDTLITARVKAALMADPDIKSFDVGVLTVKGEVQLSGQVGSQSQIEQATQLARATEGVTGVRNEMRIKS